MEKSKNTTSFLKKLTKIVIIPTAGLTAIGLTAMIYPIIQNASLEKEAKLSDDFAKIVNESYIKEGTGAHFPNHYSHPNHPLYGIDEEHVYGTAGDGIEEYLTETKEDSKK